MTERRLLELANNALRHHPGEFDHIVSQLGLMQEHYVDRRKPKAAPRSMVASLPERQVDLKFVAEKDEYYSKCLICLEMYEDQATVKTLPCSMCDIF